MDGAIGKVHSQADHFLKPPAFPNLKSETITDGGLSNRTSHKGEVSPESSSSVCAILRALLVNFISSNG